MKHSFDITEFGAIADGNTDCTTAIQAALDEARKVQGKVVIPSGEYLCGYVKVPRHVMIQGTSAWSFSKNGGSVLKLNDGKAPCILDITGAIGCTIDGICLDGGNLGAEVHGILIDKENRTQYMEESAEGPTGGEDTPTISNCRIGYFTGDAVHFWNVWCFSIRNSMLCYSRKGLFVHGCDCFITDNWFSYNREDGVYADFFMSGTFTGNRFECNYGNGVQMYSCGGLQFCNNYFDANEKHGFYSADADEDFRGNLNFIGNVFYRNGFKLSGRRFYEEESHTHISVAHATNVLISSNTFAADAGGPAYGVVIKELRNSVITNNTFMNASYKQNLVDFGGHKDDMIVSGNVGLNKVVCDEKIWPRFAD